MTDTVIDGRRARGDASRRAVMTIAVDLASVDGLDGLSIGGLATAAAKSKGGIAGLFGSKQELQLATIAAAAEIFTDRVIRPALARPAGLARLRALVEGWLDYSESRVFSGGCFFAAAAAECRSKPGPVRDAVADFLRRWHEFIAGAIGRAVATGELKNDTDAEQLAFEITALLDAANDASLLFESPDAYRRARTSIDGLLARAT